MRQTLLEFLRELQSQQTHGHTIAKGDLSLFQQFLCVAVLTLVPTLRYIHTQAFILPVVSDSKHRTSDLLPLVCPSLFASSHISINRVQVWLKAILGESIVPTTDGSDISPLELHVSRIALTELKGIVNEGQGRPGNKGVGMFPKLTLGPLISEAIRFQVAFVLPVLYPKKQLRLSGGRSYIFGCGPNQFRVSLFRPGLEQVWKGNDLDVSSLHPRRWRTLCVNYCKHDLQCDARAMEEVAFTMMHTSTVQQNHYVVSVVDDVAHNVAQVFGS